MSSNKENAKEKVEGEKVAIEKAAAADNKEEEKTDLVSDELREIEKVQIIDFDISMEIRRIFPFYRTEHRTFISSICYFNVFCSRTKINNCKRN